MAINYEPVGWDTTKHFNPTNMNHMDGGIKAACDKVDKHDSEIAEINNNLQNANKSITMNAFDNGVLANGLLVDLYDKNGVNNKPQLVQNGITSQIPSDCAWGTREVFFYSCNETAKVSYLTVKITGCDTDGKPGLWQNLFNGNNWHGWVRIGN